MSKFNLYISSLYLIYIALKDRPALYSDTKRENPDYFLNGTLGKKTIIYISIYDLIN